MKGGGCARVTSGVVTISPGTVSEYSDHQGPDAEGPGDSLWWKAVFERKPREQRDHSWGCCCHTHTHRKVKKTRLVPGHQNLTQVHERPPFINRWDNTAPLPGFEFKSTTCFFFFFFFVLSFKLLSCLRTIISSEPPHWKGKKKKIYEWSALPQKTAGFSDLYHTFPFIHDFIPWERAFFIIFCSHSRVFF